MINENGIQSTTTANKTHQVPKRVPHEVVEVVVGHHTSDAEQPRRLVGQVERRRRLGEAQLGQVLTPLRRRILA